MGIFLSRLPHIVTGTVYVRSRADPEMMLPWESSTPVPFSPVRVQVLKGLLSQMVEDNLTEEMLHVANHADLVGALRHALRHNKHHLLIRGRVASNDELLRSNSTITGHELQKLCIKMLNLVVKFYKGWAQEWDDGPVVLF